MREDYSFVMADLFCPERQTRKLDLCDSSSYRQTATILPITARIGKTMIQAVRQALFSMRSRNRAF